MVDFTKPFSDLPPTAQDSLRQQFKEVKYPKSDRKSVV